MARYKITRHQNGKTTLRRAHRKDRNAPCPCGSGRKYKHCCLRDEYQERVDYIDAKKQEQERLRQERLEEMIMKNLDLDPVTRATAAYTESLAAYTNRE